MLPSSSYMEQWNWLIQCVLWISLCNLGKGNGQNPICKRGVQWLHRWSAPCLFSDVTGISSVTSAGNSGLSACTRDSWMSRYTSGPGNRRTAVEQIIPHTWFKASRIPPFEINNDTGNTLNDFHQTWDISRWRAPGTWKHLAWCKSFSPSTSKI